MLTFGSKLTLLNNQSHLLYKAMKFSSSIPHPFGEGLCLGGLEILTTL